ncbi:hypothetical protein GCM10027456_77220 [Kineosporia babensis]
MLTGLVMVRSRDGSDDTVMNEQRVIAQVAAAKSVTAPTSASSRTTRTITAPATTRHPDSRRPGATGLVWS